MKIAVIGTVGIPAKYGGFETLVEYLTKEKGQDLNFSIYCSSKEYSHRRKKHNHAKLKYIPLKANGIQSIPYDIISILDGVFKSDTLLILGVSGCIILPLVKFFSGKKIIVNIDGLEWKRDKWGKAAKWFLKLSEKVAVKNASIVIADNKIIQDHVMSCYGIKAKLISYGADHCNAVKISTPLKEKYPFLGEPYAFKVCRIEPENNIHLILRAFGKIKNLNLIIIGNWDSSHYAQNLKIQYSEIENIFLLDPIYDQNELNQIRSNCYLYVHGHSAGGTNPSLVEAMYLKLPILAYGINYNRETTRNKALYFDNDESLIELLKTVDKEKLEKVAEVMFKIAQDNYTWKRVADQYVKSFNRSQ